MDTIEPNSSLMKISATLDKVYKSIRESHMKKVPEQHVKEIEMLRKYCKSENKYLSLMCCQTFVRLAEENTMDHLKVLQMLISMVPNSSSSQQTILTDAIFELLLLTLNRKLSTIKKNENFQCPYNLKTTPHPINLLLQSGTNNASDIANKLVAICNHTQKSIKNNSLEFLRPVFLNMFCSSHVITESKIVWNNLLVLSDTNAHAKLLILELLGWSKISNAATCLHNSMLLIQTIDHFRLQKDYAVVIDLCLYQALMINFLNENVIDPRPSLHCLLRALRTVNEHSRDHYNVLLILLANCMHNISPHYLTDVLRIAAFIVIEEKCGHAYILNMLLDGIIQWMSQTTFIPAEGLSSAHEIVQKIVSEETNVLATAQTCNTNNLRSQFARNFHTDIAIAFDLAKLVESLQDSDNKNVFSFVDALSIKENSALCSRLQYFLRAMFLSNEPSVDCWFKIYEALLGIINQDAAFAYDFVMSFIFKLAKETNPEIQMELLRGLPNFAVSKHNVPVILSTIKHMYPKNVPFCMDLYLRLWRVEPRTYNFLVKLISLPRSDEIEQWEFQVAKNYTIRAICEQKPQHGSDFVSLLSNTFNICTEETDDLATSLALDAIVILCENHIINMVSAWQILSQKFRHEKRPLATKSLYRFFARLPMLHSPTVEYEQAVDEALEQLFHAITSNNLDTELVDEALAALKNYEPGELLTLRHIPPQLLVSSKNSNANQYNNIERRRNDDESVPGNTWVLLLQKIRPEHGVAVADLIAHYISSEIDKFGKGLYYHADAKEELMQGPLGAVINYLQQQASFGETIVERHAITIALRAISKKFSKPMPQHNWTFLRNFFELSEARKYCILILKNQYAHSTSARKLLERMLLEFEPNCFEEDLLLLISLLPDLVNVVDAQIIKNFSENIAVYCFKISQTGGFAEGCLFEKLLQSIKRVFTNKCEIPEILDALTLIVERHFDSMDVDSKLFEVYTEVVSVLSVNAIDGLTTPANWFETPLAKLKKATIIRCYLVLYNSSLSNHLNWLLPIIEAYSTKPQERVFFYRHLSVTLCAYNNDEKTNEWTHSYLFPEIQTLLAESSIKEKLERAIYLLDIFIIFVDVLSGCAALLGSLDNVATDKNERFEIFPESLQMLCEHLFWKERETQTYEILYNFYKHPAMPSEVSNVFKKAIICSHNKPYFDNKSVWSKYVGLRK